MQGMGLGPDVAQCPADRRCGVLGRLVLNIPVLADARYRRYGRVKRLQDHEISRASSA